MDINVLARQHCSRIGMRTFVALALSHTFLFTCCVAGCRKPAATAGPPAPAVTVARPVQREVIEWDEYTGRLEAVETVEVRARVSGFIEKADFQEGSLVKSGDV